MAGGVLVWHETEIVLTEVVLTPQSKAGAAGEGAGGVSIHSNFSSEVELLILLGIAEFYEKVRCKTYEGAEGPCQVGTVWKAQTLKRT